MPKAKWNRLAADTRAAGIHPITGQETEEGTLLAGTPIKRVRETRDEHDGSVVTEYLASTDGGRTWYLQRTHARVALAD